MDIASQPTSHFCGVSKGSSAATTRLSLTQLAQLSGVGTAELDSLMAFGVLGEILPDQELATFDIGLVMTLQRAQRLRRDLALDEHSFALAVMLLREVSDLEDEVRFVRSEALRYLADAPATPRPSPPSATHSQR